MALKRTSSGSLRNSAFGTGEFVAIWKIYQRPLTATLSRNSRIWRLRTVAAWPDIAGLRIFALRGIVGEARRESLLSGLHNVAQEGRRNINGSKADIAVRQWRTRHFASRSVYGYASWHFPRSNSWSAPHAIKYASPKIYSLYEVSSNFADNTMLL